MKATTSQHPFSHSPCLMSVRSQDSVNFVQDWLDALCENGVESPDPRRPLTPLSLFQPSPPLDSDRPSCQKLKRRLSMERPKSPQKRQRVLRDDEDIDPDQSASIVNPTELSERTTLSHSRSAVLSPKRAVSPVRDLLNDLRAATPAVMCELPFTLGSRVPERVRSLQRLLSDNLEAGVIPMGLKVYSPTVIVHCTCQLTVRRTVSSSLSLSQQKRSQTMHTERQI
jgi:hypothetical protein